MPKSRENCQRGPNYRMDTLEGVAQGDWHVWSGNIPPLHCHLWQYGCQQCLSIHFLLHWLKTSCICHVLTYGRLYMMPFDFWWHTNTWTRHFPSVTFFGQISWLTLLQNISIFFQRCYCSNEGNTGYSFVCFIVRSWYGRAFLNTNRRKHILYCNKNCLTISNIIKVPLIISKLQWFPWVIRKQLGIQWFPWTIRKHWGNKFRPFFCLLSNIRRP